MSNNLTRSLHKIGFAIKKHSPELCTIAGIGGMVVATVMACKATTLTLSINVLQIQMLYLLEQNIQKKMLRKI